MTSGKQLLVLLLVFPLFLLAIGRQIALLVVATYGLLVETD